MPIGVVGAIIPWNFPLLMQAWKLGPALAAGCTVVMKLSEKTPLSGMLVCQLIKEAGFPPGVVNVLNGWVEAGEAIGRHMDIDKVAFTGSSLVGHKIVSMSAESNLKKVTLELGGKSPLIVFADCDLNQAMEVVNFGNFFNVGQCCCAATRIFVERPIYEKLTQMLSDRAKKVVVDQRNNPDAFLGPLVDKIQFDKVMGYIQSGKQEVSQGRARLLTGGNRKGNRG